MQPFHWSDATQTLHAGPARFDAWSLAWITDATPPAEARPVSPTAALRLVFSGHARRVPVGVIGPRAPTPRQAQTAESLGRVLAESGLQLLCGGKSGVMEAVCKGFAAAGGMAIGLLPDEEWTAANPHVAIPIATGIGPARNAIIARACSVLIAVGGGNGTLSEIAFGLQFGRRVLTLEDAPVVSGAQVCSGIAEVMEHVAAHFLAPGDLRASCLQVLRTAG